MDNRWMCLMAGFILGLIASALGADIAGKKVLMIIAHENFRDEELQEPKTALEAKGVRVTLASSTLEEAKGMLGGRARPDLLLKDVNPSDYDAVIFVGGMGATEYFDNPTAHKIAQDAAAQGKVVGAICIAPSILANAGLLKDKAATCYRSESGNLKSKGAKYTGEAVERDGKIVTAEGPKAARAFAEAIIQALSE